MPAPAFSGDIFLAFSVADPMSCPDQAPPVITRQSINWTHLDPLYLAVDAAVINAIVANADARFAMVKPKRGGLPSARLRAAMAKYGRLPP